MGCAFSRANQQFRKRQAVKQLQKNVIYDEKLMANDCEMRIPVVTQTNDGYEENGEETAKTLSR